ncbi:hypothetical protein EMIT047CA2_150122 [Pseudomonas soli]
MAESSQGTAGLGSIIKGTVGLLSFAVILRDATHSTRRSSPLTLVQENSPCPTPTAVSC